MREVEQNYQVPTWREPHRLNDALKSTQFAELRLELLKKPDGSLYFEMHSVVCFIDEQTGEKVDFFDVGHHYPINGAKEFCVDELYKTYRVMYTAMRRLFEGKTELDYINDFPKLIPVLKPEISDYIQSVVDEYKRESAGK